jgi:hypothetical protein
MKGLIGFAGMTIASALGWWLGSLHSLLLAVVLSSIASGFGLYYARKLAEEYLE